MNKAESKGLNVSVRSFLTAILVIFLLMVLCYILTFIIPGNGLPFWKWALSPFLAVGAEGGGCELRQVVSMERTLPADKFVPDSNGFAVWLLDWVLTETRCS